MFRRPTKSCSAKTRRRLTALVVIVCAGIWILCPVGPSAFGDAERNIEKFATKRVQPPFPQAASQYKIEGVVTILVTVGEDGKVTQAEFIRGQNVFRSVSLDAAKRWQFKLPDTDPKGVIRFTFKLAT